MKITSLNLNGIRSAAKKGLIEWVNHSQIDVLCVQEMKAQACDIFGQFDSIGQLNGYFHFAQKKGYSGVGIYTRHAPSAVFVGFSHLKNPAWDEFDAEGRYIELHFDTPTKKMAIISTYFPSGASGDERQAAKFRFLALMGAHLQALQSMNEGQSPRSFILCGDLNIAHQEMDLKNFKSNRKNSGFLPEERQWMTNALASKMGDSDAVRLVDVYRHLHPDEAHGCYTWWSNRGQAYANNVGWRVWITILRRQI